MKRKLLIYIYFTNELLNLLSLLLNAINKRMDRHSRFDKDRDLLPDNHISILCWISYFFNKGHAFTCGTHTNFNRFIWLILAIITRTFISTSFISSFKKLGLCLYSNQRNLRTLTLTAPSSVKLADLLLTTVC